MSMKISKSAALKLKLKSTIIQTIIDSGGSLSRKDLLVKLEKSEIFDNWENETLPKSNNIRWKVFFDTVSSELVKSELLAKANGLWSTTKKAIDSVNKDVLIRTESSVEGDEEADWLGVFSGKTPPSANDPLAQEAKLLRNAFLNYERQKSIDMIDSNESFKILSNQIVALNNSEAFRKAANNKWLSRVKLIIALISGLIIGLITPVQMATNRGQSDISLISLLKHEEIDSKVSLERTLFSSEPLDEAEKIVFLAKDLRVEVKVLERNHINLIIFGLRATDSEQVALKAELGVASQTRGNISVVIIKK